MRSIEICIDYASKDEKYRDLISDWLKSVMVSWQGQITIWHRGMVLPGHSTAEEIARHQRSANLFLFLVSVDFIASDFYDSPAMRDLIRRHKAGEIQIIPVILRPTMWEGSPFSTFEPLPDNREALSSWHDRDAALLNIAQGIKKIVAGLLTPSLVVETASTTDQNGPPSASTASLCEVAILTALPVEYKAVHSHLQQPLDEIVHPSGTIYQRGKFVGDYRTWRVAVVEIGMGGTGAAVETEKAISYLKPQIILFVGIAGGIKDVSHGDVVAATKIYVYESGKARVNFEPRPEVWRASFALEQRARFEAHSTLWLARLPDPQPNPQPQVLIGPIAAGEKVLASTRTQTYSLIKSTFGDTLAVDMEGHGFLHAVQVNQSVLGLVIRGISDLIDDKSDPMSSAKQAIAARHAAAFAFQVLAKFQSA